MQFEKAVETQQVETPIVVKTRDNIVEGKLKGSGDRFSVGFTQNYPIEEFLTDNKVDFTTDAAEEFGVGDPAGHVRAHHPHGDLLPVHHEPDAGRRQQGDELRQVPGQAHEPGPAQGHVRRRGRGRRGGRGTARDQGVPRESQEVPEPRRAGAQGRAALRPSRHRQDPARAGGGRRGRRARSSASRAPTSSRCSSGSAPAACATCSTRPSRTSPASSSWTRSTPSAAIAAPAWAAGTTSASRPSTSCWSRWTVSRPTRASS